MGDMPDTTAQFIERRKSKALGLLVSLLRNVAPGGTDLSDLYGDVEDLIGCIVDAAVAEANATRCTPATPPPATGGARCPECAGKGARPGRLPPCPYCKGTGAAPSSPAPATGEATHRGSTLQPPVGRGAELRPAWPLLGAQDGSRGCVLGHVLALRRVRQARVARGVDVQRLPQRGRRAFLNAHPSSGRSYSLDLAGDPGSRDGHLRGPQEDAAEEGPRVLLPHGRV